ncbi:hypothetical protein LY76DRAFT_49107 [Colletotrichum caudatum]|nr:hypothetical protein LY76DRAFT_49107 [Colletotrichum caudatum]
MTIRCYEYEHHNHDESSSSRIGGSVRQPGAADSLSQDTSSSPPSGVRLAVMFVEILGYTPLESNTLGAGQGRCPMEQAALEWRRGVGHVSGINDRVFDSMTCVRVGVLTVIPIGWDEGFFLREKSPCHQNGGQKYLVHGEGGWRPRRRLMCRTICLLCSPP